MGFRDGSRIGSGSLGEEAIIAAMTSCRGSYKMCQRSRERCIYASSVVDGQNAMPQCLKLKASDRSLSYCSDLTENLASHKN